MSSMPQDLIDYLLKLISPPPPAAPAHYIPDLAAADWAALAAQPDACWSGLVARGTPTEAQSQELYRLLLPGAHICLIAPDQEPTGHTGACRVEDAGMEIRDTILLLDDDQGFYYVPKTSRVEREAGCQHLPTKTAGEALDREEGSAGLNSPRAGAGRTATSIHNHHPTVKAVDLMRQLLGGVPTDQGPVLDPFLGSGTTGIACLDTGHDFIGVELEPEYLTIAEARIRYWDTAKFRPRSLQLESEAPPVAAKVSGGLLLDLFGSAEEE